MRFVVFVAAGLASLVVGDEVLACPVPAACDYSSYEVKVKELTAQKEACLQSKTAELSAKDVSLANSKAEHARELAKTQAELEQFRKTAGEYKAQSVNLEKQVAALQSQVAKAKEVDEISRQLATLEKAHKDLIASSAADIAAYKAALDDTRRQSGEKLTTCERTHSTLVQDFDVYKRSVQQYESKYNELKQETDKYKEELGAVKRQLEPLVTSVYSKSHVNYAKIHVIRIGTAFATFAQKRFTALVGPDFVKLVKLQATVWGRRAHAKAIELGSPLAAKARKLYSEKLEAQWAPIISQAVEFKDKQSVVAMELGKDLIAKFLVLTERVMDRMIRNLSSVDPTINEVFGQDFTDRCFAFAFVLFCFWVASSAVTWIFNTFIGAPFCWLFGIGKSKSKKSKKAASKSGKADTNKGKTSAVKGTINPKEGGVKAADGKAVAKANENNKVVNKGDAKKTVEKGAGDVKLTTQKKGTKA